MACRRLHVLLHVVLVRKQQQRTHRRRGKWGRQMGMPTRGRRW
jgi:hypothetical protein